MGVFRFVSGKSELGYLETYMCTVWKWNDVIQIQGINCTCTRRHSQGICMKYGSNNFYLLKDRGSNPTWELMRSTTESFNVQCQYLKPNSACN